MQVLFDTKLKLSVEREGRNLNEGLRVEGLGHGCETDDVREHDGHLHIVSKMWTFWSQA